MTTESHHQELQRLLQRIQVSEVQSNAQRGEHWTIVATSWNQPSSGTFDLLLTFHAAGPDVELPSDWEIVAVSRGAHGPTARVATPSADGGSRMASREVTPSFRFEAQPHSRLETAAPRGLRPSGRFAAPPAGPPELAAAKLAGPKVWLRGLPAAGALELTMRKMTVVVETPASEVISLNFQAADAAGEASQLPQAELALPDGRHLFLSLHEEPERTLTLSLRTGSQSLPDGSRVEIFLIGSDSQERRVASVCLMEEGNGVRAAICKGIPRTQLLSADGAWLGRLEMRYHPA